MLLVEFGTDTRGNSISSAVEPSATETTASFEPRVSRYRAAISSLSGENDSATQMPLTGSFATPANCPETTSYTLSTSALDESEPMLELPPRAPLAMARYRPPGLVLVTVSRMLGRVKVRTCRPDGISHTVAAPSSVAATRYSSPQNASSAGRGVEPADMPEGTLAPEPDMVNAPKSFFAATSNTSICETVCVCTDGGEGRPRNAGAGAAVTICRCSTMYSARCAPLRLRATG